MPINPLLSVTDIDLTIGSYRVLQHVSLSLDDGQALTVVGLNGSGKTTLLRVILGLQKPDTGSVQLRRSTRIGYMPQKLQIDATLPLTVYRFVQLALPGRQSVASARTRISAGLAEVGAAAIIDQPLRAISGGELQRVMLARALARDPDLLVLDEPVQSVDVAGQHDLYELIAQVRQRRNCAVLMVSHDLHLVMPTTDQVICMNHHVCCSGPPETVTRDPAYRELFGLDRDRDRQLAVYHHHHDHHHDASGDVVDTH